MKHFIALSTLLFALNASAECPSSVPTEMPAIPAGPAANEETMRGAGVAVRAYVAHIEEHLNCRDKELTDRSYNELVDRAIAAADAYNRELRLYQRQGEVLAKN
jgi:hypothetical protein